MVPLGAGYDRGEMIQPTVMAAPLNGLVSDVARATGRLLAATNRGVAPVTSFFCWTEGVPGHEPVITRPAVPADRTWRSHQLIRSAGAGSKRKVELAGRARGPRRAMNQPGREVCSPLWIGSQTKRRSFRRSLEYFPLGAHFFKGHQATNITSTVTEQVNLFVVQDVYFERNDEPNIVYKRKLRIVLRNESGKDVTVKPAKWETSTGDIAVQPLREHPWRLEGTGGWENGSWGPERPGEAVHVAPGRVLQTWVGLLPSADEVEMRRRHETRRLGTLIIPFNMGGRDEAQRIRL
jgi:hypothetical protein